MVNSENIENLEKERHRVANELDRLRLAATSSDERREGSPFGKREEEADEVMELDKRLAMEKYLAELLIEIEHALSKYKDGTYGICDRCGNAIEAGRLEALPQASLCLACKSRHMKELRGR
jgi:DnaK suppressor protein